MNDQILIEGLTFYTIVGIRPAERRTQQPLVIDVQLDLDTLPAATTGDINDTVDYAQLCDRLSAFVQAEAFELLETLAEACCALILDKHPNVQRVELTVRKPQAVASADAVGLRISRARSQ